MRITDHGIHILPGESAAGSWLAAFEAEDRLLFVDDDLNCGPLRHFDALSTWTAMRQTFWNSVRPESAELSCHTYEHNVDSKWLRTSARLRDAASIYIWSGNDLPDQLFLLFTIHLIDRAGADPANIHLVPIKVFPHQNGRYISVGSNSPDELKRHPEPIRISAEDHKIWQLAWEAVVSDTPVALAGFIDTDTTYTSSILSNLLQRYPERASGLSLWDRMLLNRVVTSGPNAAYVVAEVLCDTWENGDSAVEPYLFYRLKQLAGPQNAEPLLMLTGNTDNCRGAEVRLTNFGKSVFEGRASNYPTNPIDEWIGGTHLSSGEGNVWMYEGKELRQFTTD